jgi:hypothetical protein
MHDPLTAMRDALSRADAEAGAAQAQRDLFSGTHETVKHADADADARAGAATVDANAEASVEADAAIGEATSPSAIRHTGER